MTRIAVVVVGLGLLTVGPARAQLIVHDPAVTLRNSVTAAIQALMARVQDDRRQRIERMARRITAFTNLGKYVIAETPEWRIHDFWSEDVLFAHDYHAALNYGDGRGVAYTRLIEPVLAVADEGIRLSAAAWPALRARLATIDATDAVTIAATNDTGLLRYNGRRDQAAIEALQAQVIDPSLDESATAVLDKISGGAVGRGETAPGPCRVHRRHRRAVGDRHEAGPRHRGHRAQHAAHHLARRTAGERGTGGGHGRCAADVATAVARTEESRCRHNPR
jgi:hypothetical protein